MNDMSAAIVPKSDQLNSDDLISGPLTIRITDVRIKPGTEQPVSIYFEGDNGKPWKSCKSMSRVLVAAWGPDASNYVGRSLTLYRDPSVKWAGADVGGIRISHMSHIEKPITMALTVTKGSRKPYTVKVLAGPQPIVPVEPPTVADYDSCDGPGYKLLEPRRKKTLEAQSPQLRADLEAARKRAFDRLSAAAKANTGTVQPEQPVFDPAACLQQLATPADAASLEAAWDAACNHYQSLGQDVPREHEAAYIISKEQFA